MSLKMCLAGEGAMGLNHMTSLRQIEGVEVVSLACGVEKDGAAFAKEWEIPHYSLDFEECLNQPGVEAVLLASPNQVHAEQAITAMRMGKHVQVEIPMGLTLEDSERVVATERETGQVCMVCHTKRYQGPFREVRRRVLEGDLHLHHIVQHTYFFRRENTNMFGKPRSWTDELLWHQACHMVDYVYWLFEEPAMEVWAKAGPDHKDLAIPMDITMSLRPSIGCLVTSAHSFNNHGPISSDWRFIGEEETLLIGKSGLTDHEGNAIPADGNGIVDQDTEFVTAIRENRRSLTSCVDCLPVMGILDRLQKSIEAETSH